MEIQMIDLIWKFFIKVKEIDLWAAISAVSAFTGLVVAMQYVKTRSYTRGLNFFIAHSRESGTNFPNKIVINIRNYSGKTVVLTNPYFKFSKTVVPDESAACDSYTKDYEVKFENPEKKYLNEVDIMLRHKETTITFIPADPNESDEKIKAAIENHAVGVLFCNTVWLEDKPKVIKIRKKI